MKRVFIIILLSSMAFLLNSYFGNKENYEIINLENIEEIQCYIFKTNKTTVITNPNQIADIVSVIKKINSNTNTHIPKMINEEEIIYQLYVIPEGYYPGGPISITQNLFDF